jgi:hypothetical protein
MSPVAHRDKARYMPSLKSTIALLSQKNSTGGRIENPLVFVIWRTLQQRQKCSPHHAAEEIERR